MQPQKTLRPLSSLLLHRCTVLTVRQKVKNNLRFAKGVKEIKTSVEEQKVYVTYDAQKTNEEKLQKAFEKFGYKAEKLQRRLKSLFMRTRSARICNR